MATPMYLPNPVAAMPQPRFFAPQQNYSSVFGGAIQSLTSVADNFRRKQQAVEAAEKMATLMENEGMEMEANAYRQAAGAFNTNFFSTPDQNEQFNRGILSDALKLVTEKQERDIRASAQQVQKDYYEGLLQNSRDRINSPSSTASIREGELEERKRYNTMRAFQAETESIDKSIAALEKQQDDNLKRVQEKILTKEEGARLHFDIERRKENLAKKRDALDAQARSYMNPGSEQQVYPTYSPRQFPRDISTKQDVQIGGIGQTAEAMRQAGVRSANGVTLPSPGSRTTKTGPDGVEIEERVPLIDPNAATKGVDPNRPKFDLNALTQPQQP